MCTSSSVFSVRYYVEGSRVTHPPCPKASLVSKDNTNQPVDHTSVNYYCTQNVDNYVKSIKTRSDVLQPDKRSLFRAELVNNGTDCQFDVQSGAYSCSVVSENVTQVSPPTRCHWDDGYTRAPLPEYDNTANIHVCKNAVLDVLYDFTWDGTTIALLNATIILGDLPVSQERVTNRTITYSEATNDTQGCIDIRNDECVKQKFNVSTEYIPAVVTQYFKVEYNHIMRNKSSTDNITEESRYQRSGYIGISINTFTFYIVLLIHLFQKHAYFSKLTCI